MDRRLWIIIGTALIIVITGIVTNGYDDPQVSIPVSDVPLIEQLEAKEPPKIEEKKVVWQDNPNNCTDSQYIRADNFECIDKPVSKPAPVIQAPVISGSKQDWLRASGIPEVHWGYVDAIVSRESGWNPNAVNASSGACGLGQQLPCGKWAGAWNDPVAALIAMNGYVNARYGGWAGAMAFWNVNHWY